MEVFGLKYGLFRAKWADKWAKWAKVGKIDLTCRCISEKSARSR